MKATTIRFSDTGHRLLEEAARAEGIPFAQYVREAALARVAFERGLALGEGKRAEDRDRVGEFRQGIAEVRRLAADLLAASGTNGDGDAPQNDERPAPGEVPGRA